MKEYNIKKVNCHGESGSVDEDVITEWMIENVEELQAYDDDDIYNFDETSLFYRMPLTKGISTSQLSGVKKNRMRITVGLCCSKSGENSPHL